ncbi:MAG: response regulator [Sphingomonadales bacterium]|nr:response regulator [Sphingomonadales bacterium]
MSAVFNIVVIDDDDLVCETIVSFLEIAGHNVSSANDGDKGIEIIKDTKPNLVITDIVMPTKEGMETIIDIKKFNSDTKIIAISGQGWSSGVSYLEMAERLGANATISKPFTRQDLMDTVAEVMA